MKDATEKYNSAIIPLSTWISEIKNNSFNNHNELKNNYPNASILNTKRVVFNIKGNDYRLIVDIEYKLKIIFIIWFGTHAEYDKIDAKTIKYAS